MTCEIRDNGNGDILGWKDDCDGRTSDAESPVTLGQLSPNGTIQRSDKHMTSHKENEPPDRYEKPNKEMNLTWKSDNTNLPST